MGTVTNIPTGVDEKPCCSKTLDAAENGDKAGRDLSKLAAPSEQKFRKQCSTQK